MKHSAFLATMLVATVSVCIFSGQMTRPYSQPQRQQAQPQQRPVTQQPVQQRQATATPPKSVPSPAPEMPLLFWLPKDIEFPPSRNITLVGDPKNEGLYVTRTLIPKGTQTMPHTHPDSRTVTVISGICYYGHGEEFDESRLIPMPPGAFFTEPAGIPHFIWAKDGDVIVQTTAIGPSGTQLVPIRKN
jgi:quercetin dioxygenase-like cupin family protein